MIKTCMLTGVEYEASEQEAECITKPVSRYINRIVPATELSIFADIAYSIYRSSIDAKEIEQAK